MKYPYTRQSTRRSGAALLLSLLVLLVIVAVVFQISISTNTDAQVARNDLTMTGMDLAIESAFLQSKQTLRDDSDAGAAGGDSGSPQDLPGDIPNDMGDAPGEGGGAATDSFMDEWGKPQSTTINDIELRILIQDEDSKYNVLNMFQEDEDEAEKAYERVARILDACREGTEEDIGKGTADEMARVMRDHWTERSDSYLARTILLSDDEENENLGMPLSLRELVVLEPFEERHFRDYFDVDNERVHSIESFLTIWTAPYTTSAEGEDAEPTVGGFGVNLNRAPMAVLASLMDDRDLNARIWDGVLEYRNLEEEDEDQEEDADPILDEFGNETFPTRVFEDLGELTEVWGWDALEPDVRTEAEALLMTESAVFSIYITARHSTAQEGGRMGAFENRADKEEYERQGTDIVRTVRMVVWRDSSGEETVIIPLLRWEILGYSPLEVLDYPDEDY
jgi:hypothetical protein